MEIYAEVKGIRYKVFLKKPLPFYHINEISKALSERGSFILEIDKENQIAISWWVSPKRTRSYPYSRVYDTLSFAGKKVTIIPIMKDEGKDGDRDFLQWDTISLMSLLGIYTIVGYYVEAERNPNFTNKITNQKFDVEYLKNEIVRLSYYQSDALHWNLEQIDKIWEIANRALDFYNKISKNLGVEMHSIVSARKHIEKLYKSREEFIKTSRNLARKAQIRETSTLQPKEFIAGKKGIITIKNYLGGIYYFTCDEIKIEGKNIYLIESKYTSKGLLPSEEDIKDGLLKMVLYTNLKNVMYEGNEYNAVPILRLTTRSKFRKELLPKSKLEMLEALEKEAEYNGFKIEISSA